MKRFCALLVVMSCMLVTADNRSDEILSATLRVQLQEDYKDTDAQLNELSGILEYLGQVVNKEAIADPIKKREVRNWIFEQNKKVQEIRKIDRTANEQTLVEVLRAIKAHLLYLLAAIKNNLDSLEPFIPPVLEQEVSLTLTDEQTIVVNRTIGQLLQGNRDLLKQINDSIATLGLTTTNIWARWLDRVNTDYGITDKLEKLPKYLVLSAAAMYVLPYKYFFFNQQEIPGLNWLKRKIGALEYWDKEGFVDIGFYGRDNDKQEYLRKKGEVERATNKGPEPSANLTGLLNSPEKKTFIAVLAGAGYLLFKDPIKEYLDPVKSYLRPRWNALKGFNVVRMDKPKQPDITLDDPRLIGLDSQIKQMKNIVRYIIEPETFDRSASGLEKGILLTGPSRNGKTLLANALCGSINEAMQKKGLVKKFAFKQVKWSDVRWQNEGIKSILEDAKRNAPCVLFLDELHNLPLQVKEGGEILSQFLTMSESLQSTGLGDAVIILAATNRPYALDDALLKPGRFGLQIHFESPTFELRKKVFATECKNNSIPTENLDLDQLARLTENCSYGDLDMVFKNARFTARHEKRRLEQKDFLHTIYEHIYRIKFDNESPLTEDAHRLIATHQAGHALVHMLYQHELHERLEVVTTRGQWAQIEEKRFNIDDVHTAHNQKKTEYGHIFVSHHSEAVTLGASPEIKAKLLLAGAMAEEILLGSTTLSYHEKDTHDALQVLEEYVFKGLSKDDFTKQELEGPKKEAKRLFETVKHELRELLTQEKAGLQRLSEALQKQLLLTYTEVKEILEIQKK